MILGLVPLVQQLPTKKPVDGRVPEAPSPTTELTPTATWNWNCAGMGANCPRRSPPTDSQAFGEEEAGALCPHPPLLQTRKHQWKIRAGGRRRMQAGTGTGITKGSRQQGATQVTAGDAGKDRPPWQMDGSSILDLQVVARASCKGQMWELAMAGAAYFRKWG